MQLVPMFGNFAYMIVAFVVSLSIIVAIHEYGHYIVGRWSGIHADVFSIGFGPVLFSRMDKHGTQWQVAALPFGGYVKFLGDANAASVGSDGTVPAVDARRTMLGAPLWARAATVAAGPIFNFILAIAIFTGTAMYQGRAIEPLTMGEMIDLPPSYQNELQVGDLLIAVNGVPFDEDQRDGTISDELTIEQVMTYDIIRGGTPMQVNGPIFMPSAVSAVTPRSAADDAGVRKNDVITAIDGVPVFAFQQVIEAVGASGDKDLTLTLWRDGRMLDLDLSARHVDNPLPGGGFEKRRLIGISGSPFFFNETETLGLWESVSFGFRSLWNTLETSLSGLKHIVLGKISTCNLSGPVGIAETSGSMAAQGPQSFIWFIAVLSVAVGMVNLFPIPVMDGGHLVFYAYEAVTRRKPTDKVVRVFMSVGLVLILSLMSFTLLNDTILCP